MRIAIVSDIQGGLDWPGVLGNTDEMLFNPQSMKDFASGSPNPQPLFAVIEEMAKADREALGEERIAWLSQLPRMHVHGPIALVHASPTTAWKSPAHSASDADLESVYSPLGQPIVIYGHIHRPYIRTASALTVANSGSVSLSYDGDPRASYLLLDDSTPSIRRVEYDVEGETKALAACGLPHSEWIAKMLRSASAEMP